MQWWKNIFLPPIPDQILQILLENGECEINIEYFIDNSSSIIENACKIYSSELPGIFSVTNHDIINDKTTFNLQLPQKEIIPAKTYRKIYRFLTIEKESNKLNCVLSPDNVAGKKQLMLAISESIKEVVFNPCFPNAFIVIAERSGATIFKKELNFNRNRLLERMVLQPDKDPRDLMVGQYTDYPLPIKVNVDFIRQLKEIKINDSFIFRQHPEIIDAFHEILGGKYLIGEDDAIYFNPHQSRTAIPINSSSAASRSLLPIAFYLRHVVKKGDILMVDEPELNLHPSNQRKLARLFARLSNLGVKVFITTHSDYILKELNTLIMLSGDRPHLKRVAEQEGYHVKELISPDHIRVHLAKVALLLLDGNQRKSRCLSFFDAMITVEHGIEAITFDETIEEINRIHEAIRFGDEEESDDAA